MCDKIEIEGVMQDSQGRGGNDRPGDPMFPLMPQVLEALRARAKERLESLGESGSGRPVDEYRDLIETICGTIDDSQPVEQYDGTLGVTRQFVDTHQRAVGQIQWNDNLAAIYSNAGNVSGARWCSGTLVSDDLFVTAGHCFDQTGGGWERPRVNGTSNIIPSSEIATNMHVNFNFQVDANGNPRPVSQFGITALVEYRLGGLDFAIIRLAGNPGQTWGRTAISSTDATQGEMLCIMGHPAGVPKRVEAGPALAPSGTRIRYDDIDTQGGNSGSGVIRASDGRIVGIHTNGGCSPNSPNGNDANFGQRIVAVIQASPTLQALTRPKTKAADDVGVITTPVRDQIARPTLKFIDDNGGVTGVVLDQIGTRKGLDDVKRPALDKRLGDVKLPGLDGRPPIDPGRPVFRGPGEMRPFALAIPHHSMAWAAEAAPAAQSSDAESYESALAQLGELIGQQQQVLVQLDADYRALLAEYQQAMGNAPGG